METVSGALPLDFEAFRKQRVLANSIRLAFEYSKDWARYESFSARPYLFASSIASSFIKCPDEGVRLAEEGLITNPGHGGLINNQAFCLVSAGKPTEARKILRAVDAKIISASATVCLIATEGLIEYRMGNAEAGRILYKNAIQEATRRKLTPLRIRAMLYLAREESIVSAPGAEGLFESAQSEAQKSGARDLVALAGIDSQFHFASSLSEMTAGVSACFSV